MQSKLFLLACHKKTININLEATSRVRFGILTENQFLHSGISYLVDNDKALSEVVNIIGLSFKEWLIFPERCDFLITDHRMKSGLVLFFAKSYSKRIFTGCDLYPEVLLSVVYRIVRYWKY